MASTSVITDLPTADDYIIDMDDVLQRCTIDIISSEDRRRSQVTTWPSTLLGSLTAIAPCIGVNVAIRLEASGVLQSVCCIMAIAEEENDIPVILATLEVYTRCCSFYDVAFSTHATAAHQTLAKLMDDKKDDDISDQWNLVRDAAANAVSVIISVGVRFPMRSRDVLELDAQLPLRMRFVENVEELGTMVELQRVSGRYNGKGMFSVGYLLWLSSVILARWLLQSKSSDLIRGKDVLELGSGLGLPGLLSCLSASSVVMSDFNPTVVQTLNNNITRNRQIPNGCCKDTPALAVLLDWTVLPPLSENSGSENIEAAMRLTDSEKIVNFGHPCLNRRFDIILAADIICQTEDVHAIADVLHRFLKPEGRAIFVLPCKEHRWGMDSFVSHLTKREFIISTESIHSEMSASAETNVVAGDLDRHHFEHIHTQYTLYHIRKGGFKQRR